MLYVDREVDPRFELAAVVARSQKESDLPILFRSVRGTRFPVVSNIYGSNRRLREMVGAGDANLCRRWAEIMRTMDAMGSDYLRVIASPEPLESGVIADLPQITWREKDAGPYITAGVFLAKDPDTGVPNLSFARTWMTGNDEMLCCIDPVHDLGNYQARAEARGEPLDIAILIGAPPEIFIAGCASVPIDVDELKVAAAIRGHALPMRRCSHVDLLVPESTEVVIEGRILPNVRRKEGPFGEYMGYYGRETDGYVIQVLSVTWRRDPLYHGLLCGTPEDLTVLDVAFATKTYRALSDVPGVLDVTCNPMLYCSVVSIDKRYEGHPQQVMLKTFGASPYYNYMCIVVDKDVDIRNMKEVMWAYLTRGRLDRRIMVIPDVPGWELDKNPIYGGRIGIDATMPLDRRDEFERTSTPGESEINLKDYVTRQ